MRSYSEAALLSWVPSCSCAARFARKMASNIAPRALSRTPSPRDADFKMAAAAAGVEPERQRHPRRLFPRPGRPSTRIDSVPARQGRAALANLGIDHSAIAVSDTDQSVAFYRDRLGLRIAGTSDNWGVEQERLSAVPGAHVCITTLRAGSGPGVELLHYLMPTDGRPMPVDTTADDLWTEEIVLRTALAAHFGEWLRDPDGHAVGLVADREEASR